jgi:hypothetical protein
MSTYSLEGRGVKFWEIYIPLITFGPLYKGGGVQKSLLSCIHTTPYEMPSKTNGATKDMFYFVPILLQKLRRKKIHFIHSIVFILCKEKVSWKFTQRIWNFLVKSFRFQNLC